jgi:tRNA(Ile)-lysidine synthase
MLAALSSLRQERDFVLRCLHVEHGIRPGEESRGDAEAVRELCRTLDVPCRIISIASGRIAGTAKTRGLGIEGAARLYRHAAWNREARRIGAEKVLVAHTRDDLLETVLMRFLRGSGPRGLAAMPPSRGRVLRPLLSLNKEAVLRYLAERGIPYRTDSTNGDIAYLRNRIRNKLIPYLDALFPSWKKTVLALAETQGRTADFLEEETARRVPWRPSPGGAWTVPRETFFAQPEIIREEALFAMADRIKKEEAAVKNGMVPDRQIKNTAPPRRSGLRLFAAGQIPAADLGIIGVKIRGDALMVFPGRKRSHTEGFSLLIKEPGIYNLKGLSIEVRPSLSQNPEEKNTFAAELPLVFRKNLRDDYILYRGQKRRPVKSLNRQGLPEYRDIITAEDIKGNAAFIGLSRNGPSILICREDRNSESVKSGFSFSIMTTGGIDVQRSE